MKTIKKVLLGMPCLALILLAIPVAIVRIVWTAAGDMVIKAGNRLDEMVAEAFGDN